MAGSPQIPQGTLNRLRGSVIVNDHPELNVTAPFLSKEGISISFEGETTVSLPTLVGTVQSPEPYQMATITINMLKTQNLANLYKNRVESNAQLGNVLVTTDASTLGNYQITNCAITNVRDLGFNGESPVFAVSIRGFYAINASVWAG